MPMLGGERPSLGASDFAASAGPLSRRAARAVGSTGAGAAAGAEAGPEAASRDGALSCRATSASRFRASDGEADVPTAPATPAATLLAIDNGAGGLSLGKSRLHQATRASKRRT